MGRNKKGDTSVLHTRLPKSLYAEIIELAKKERRDISNMACNLLEDAIKFRKLTENNS